ncbi:MAG: Hpt domain-containing protein [Myxococcota bacterium]|nr:Hpt domain-containing protein [Myxococcota bacterium]
MSKGKAQMRKLLDYLVLPADMTAFERSYLRRMNRVGLVFFALHIPALLVLAAANGTNPWLALALSTAIAAGPAIAYGFLRNPRAVSVVYGVAAMFMGGALVHFGQGPVQIEMHFYFFALLAMLAVFGNPLVILAAALTVALHHLALWFFLPASVFNYDAPVWVVGVHAAFVVLESVAGCFIARSFFDNVIGLEKIVQARTAELDARNRDLRRVLDNVAQGFVTIDRAGTPSAERSRVFDEWFPPSPAPGVTLFDVFEQASPPFGQWSRAAWDEVTAGVMPLALTLEQMPRDLVLGDEQYRVAYVPIGEGETPESFLVVVTNVTMEQRRLRAERDGREALHLFERLLSDRTAVNDFFDDGARLVEAIASGRTNDQPTLKRMVHTLKGNSAVFGLHSLADACHELEAHLAERGTLSVTEAAKIVQKWKALTASMETLLGEKRRVLEVDEAEHAAVELAIRRGASSAALLRMVHALKLDPTQRRMEHFGDQARRIATGLGKSLDVVVEASDLRVDRKHWGSFWSAFIHGVRNAVDHGIESPEERSALGKPALGRISLRSYVRADRFVIELEDDGRGVDWVAVAARAAARGLPVGTEAELRSALFSDGVSTAAQVTEISGRGLGMGAVQTATEALGGLLELSTAPRQGTTLRMVFPKNAMTPDLRAISLAPSAMA